MKSDCRMRVLAWHRAEGVQRQRGMSTLSWLGLLVLGVWTAECSATCPACLRRTELRSISLANIKEQILAKLGLSSPPNITGRRLPHVPPIDYFMDEYSMQSDQSETFRPGPSLLQEADDFSATIKKVIAFAQPQPKLRHWRGQEMLYFKFSDKMRENKVVRAQLWLYLKPSDTLSTASVTVLREVWGAPASETPPLTPVISTKETRPRGRGRWISLEVKKVVADWFKNSAETSGLAVLANVPGQHDLRTQHLVVLSPQTEGSSFAPFLEVHITDSKKHRTKRTVGLNCDEKTNEIRCCRYPLTVDFEEFGWDWIIAPKKYEANYCSGECPYVFLTKYPHTHIVAMAGPANSGGACCAPRKMSAITMLYFDQESNIIYGLLPGMVVDRCGCF